MLPTSRMTTCTLAQTSLVLATVLFGSSCAMEQLFPEPVGAAVGRLTVRNVASMVSVISDDATCGFSSQEVLDSVVVEGDVGTVGTMTWVVQDCELDFPTPTPVLDNCNGEVTSVEGKIVVSAVRVVEGIISGDPESPILPSSADAVHVDLELAFDGFHLESNQADTALTMKSGSLTYGADIHLATSISSGLCSIPTSNLTLSNITYAAGTEVTVKNGDQVFDVVVNGSNMQAQLGAYGDRENELKGSIMVWDSEVPVPEAGEKDALDPEYDADTFLESYTCKEDLALPVAYACKDLGPALANGIAQLSMRDYAMAAALIEADTRCGFSSDAVLLNPDVTGELGQAGGSATYTLNNPCRMDFEVPTVASEECGGAVTTVTGSVIVTGTKTLTGIVTGDVAQPIVPQSRYPATFDLRIEPIEWRAAKSTSTQALTMNGGVVEGVFRPRTALDVSTGACSIPTPVTTFEAITLTDVDVVLENGPKFFAHHVDSSRLNAQNGKKGNVENDLHGTIVVDGVEQSVPAAGEPAILDPDYTPEGLLESYACLDNLVVAESDADCDFTDTLAEGAARLVIQTVGTVAGMINADSDCGFDNLIDQAFPSEVVGDNGELGHMSWETENCVLGSASEQVYATDCIDGVTYQQGFADITASRTVYGEREHVYLVVDSVKPLHPQSIDVFLTDVVLDDFVTFAVAAGADAPPGKLTIHSGVLSAVVHPSLGEMDSDRGRFMIPTPVADIEEAVLRDAVATLWSDGKTFDVVIDEARLSAINGSIDGQANQLSGYIYINGVRKELGTMPLNPDYDQTTFDASYVCTEDLVDVLEP